MDSFPYSALYTGDAANDDDYDGIVDSNLFNDQDWQYNVNVQLGDGEPAIPHEYEPTYTDLKSYNGGESADNDCADDDYDAQELIDNLDLTDLIGYPAPVKSPFRSVENVAMSQELMKPAPAKVDTTFPPGPSDIRYSVPVRAPLRTGGNVTVAKELTKPTHARNNSSHSYKTPVVQEPRVLTPVPSVPTRQSTKKPSMSYTLMVALAIKSSPTGQMVVKEIYKYMLARFPFFRTAPASWKSSVRHTLSLSGKFMNTDIEQASIHARKRCMWSIIPDHRAKIEQGIQQAFMRQNYEETEDFENNSAAAAIAPSTSSHSGNHNYHTQRKSEFNFQPVTKKMSAAIAPSSSSQSVDRKYHVTQRDHSQRQGHFNFKTVAQNMSAATAIAPSSSSQSVNRNYHTTPRDHSQRQNHYNFKPVPQNMLRPSSSTVRAPSDIRRFESNSASRQSMQTAPIRQPAILRKRPAASSASTAPPAKYEKYESSYEPMSSPERESTEYEQDEFRGDPNDINLFF